MTLRITVLEERPVRRLRVEGRLSSEEVAELESMIGADPHGTCLDLADLRSADSAAIAVLRRLRAQGLRMSSLPQHLAWRLE